ncbi:DUF2442 domain-containing protein [Dyadobacter sp. LJ53]|uniref:DUF2442 domain-containing protein n=1 Tax=Dyadobacter chenwenxiniae TaxID=2906456 RepID=UPI001F259D54|nr:DUF2442 domain-containing protein [Dyadobacter chenwenxiniae]MCF0050071.1 DUF2442 domain-containing protein [Dyadobacter chenwenxiniae]
MILTIHVIAADYLSEYKILIKFNDGTQQVVDFEDFLMTNRHPQYDEYLDYKRFQQFKIEKGTIVWGDDWDLIFPVEQLHAGHIQF